MLISGLIPVVIGTSPASHWHHHLQVAWCSDVHVFNENKKSMKDFIAIRAQNRVCLIDRVSQ